jgi:hypothetical protein
MSLPRSDERENMRNGQRAERGGKRLRIPMSFENVVKKDVRETLGGPGVDGLMYFFPPVMSSLFPAQSCQRFPGDVV